MENETCVAVQATVGAYCGCENTIAEVNVCRICGGDNLLPDPTRMVDLLAADVSCLDLEYKANVAENMTCMDAQNAWADICCPAEAPTAVPSVKPSVSSSWSPSMYPSVMPSGVPTASLAPSPSFAPTIISGSVKTCGGYSITGLFVGMTFLLAL